jgi:hypothetical protein
VTVTNLYGVYVRVAADIDSRQLWAVIRVLRTEPEPRHPHIEQALDAFTKEAVKRGLEIDDA